MTSFFAQIWIIIKSISPYSRKCMGKSIAIVIVLVLSIVFFHYCNEIPMTHLDLEVSTYGMPNNNIELHAFLGTDAPISHSIDSLSFFYASRRAGIEYLISSENQSLLPISEYRREGCSDWIQDFRFAYPEQKQSIDSSNAMVVTNWRYQASSGRVSSLSKKTRGLYNKMFNHWDNDSTYIFRSIDSPSESVLRSTQRVLFKGPANKLAINHNVKYNNRYLNNTVLFALNDVSQAYVWFTFKGCNYTENVEISSDNYECHFSQGEAFDFEQNPLILSIDFGSPISPSYMTPMPDHITLTSIVYSSPEKLRTIENDGLSFHVRYIQNTNFQSMKLFFLTTLITALATWLLTILSKWAQYITHGRKKIKYGNKG